MQNEKMCDLMLTKIRKGNIFICEKFVNDSIYGI